MSLKAYRGMTLTAEQAKQALAVQLLNRARLDIFGAFAPTHIGRTGRKEIKKGLKGARLTSYYPIRDRPHKVMPKLNLHHGLLDYIEALQFDKSKPLSAADGDAAAAEVDDEDDKKKAKKPRNVVSADDRNRARFASLLKERIQELRNKGDWKTSEDDEALVLSIVKEHFISDKDKKMDDKELESVTIENERSAQSKKLASQKSESDVLDLARAVADGGSLDDALTADDAAAAAAAGADASSSGAASTTAVTVAAAPASRRPMLRAQLDPRLLIEHQVERAAARLSAKQLGDADTASATASVNPLARKLQELSMSPETNIAQLLYGPKFLHTSPDENYYLTPHSRQLSASQLADEQRATERRHRLLCKTLDVAPQELPAFRTYCEQAAKSLYAGGDARQQRRFAAALKKLSDPEVCLQLGEQELDAERDDADTTAVRMVVVADAATPGRFKIVADHTPEAARARDAEAAHKRTAAVQNKLLTRADAGGELLVRAKDADAADRSVFAALEKFAVGGAKALADAAEKQAVLRALNRQLDEEEAMYEALEMQELSVRQIAPVTLMELQSLRKTATGVPPMDFTDEQVVAPADLAAWSRALLTLPEAQFTALQTLVQKVHTLACVRRDTARQASLLGAIDTKEAETLRVQGESALTEQRATADELRTLVAAAQVVSRAEDAFACVAHVLKAFGEHSIGDVRTSIELVHISAQRAASGQLALPFLPVHWEAACASGAVGDARLLAAMKIWAGDRKRTTTVYEPFHPVRRRIIALRVQQAAVDDDDARLALFHERAQLHAAEVQQAVRVRSQNLDVIREHAALAYVQKAWRPKGGYVSPEDDDWEKQMNDLKEMNKFKSSKKGEGKRGKKK